MNVVNETPFTYAPFMGKVVYPKDTLTLIIKGTFGLIPDSPARPAEPGDHLPPTGDLHYDDDPRSSVRYESDFIYFKPRADVLVVGHCHVPEGKSQPACSVRFKAGQIDKSLMVFGDRYWQRSMVGTRRMSDPEPFAAMELRYENSFGGPDYSCNPVGKGIRTRFGGQQKSDDPLPNIKVLVGEQLETMCQGAPAGFGPLGRNWSQRTALSGTYGRKWRNERWPWLPEDLNWGCFNAAPPDQQVKGYLIGDEALYFENMHPRHSSLHASLPGIRVRCFVLEHKDGGRIFREIRTRLDTLWVDMDTLTLVLVWRGLVTVASKTCDRVEDILIVQEEVANEAPGPEYYRKLLDARKAGAAMAASGAEEEEKTDTVDSTAVEAAKAKVAAREARLQSMARQHMDQAHGMLDQSGLPPKLVRALKEEKDPDRLLDILEQGLDIDPKAAATVKAQSRKQLKELLDRHRPEVEKLLSELGHDPGDLNKVEAVLFQDPKSEPPPSPDAEELAAAARSGNNMADRDMGGADFSGMSLEGANFRGAQLAGADFRHARLARSDFSEANLEGARFESADLAGADFTGADLSGAHLGKANLKLANLSDAVMTGTHLSEADLREAILCRCQLTDAKLTLGRLQGADLTQADLSNADLTRADLTGAILNHALLEGADLTQAVARRVEGRYAILSKARLTEAEFTHSRMEDSNFSCCRCDFADFQSAMLNNATFEGAVGRQVNLENANLDRVRAGEGVSMPHSRFRRVTGSKANWAGADLQGSDFILANMPGCDFSATNLTGCDCRTAELKRSVFDKACLNKARFNRANLFQVRMQEADLTGANFKGCNLYGSEFLDATIDENTNFDEANLKSTKLVDLNT